MQLTNLKALALLAGLSLVVSGCQKQDSESADKTPSSSSSSGSSGSSGSSSSSSSAPNEKSENAEEKSAGKESAQDRNDGQPVDLKGAQNINVAKLPETMEICKVNGTPITVAQFKREYRDAIISLQNTLSADPVQVAIFDKQAESMNIKLEEDEKKKLLETARKPQSLEGMTLDKFLKAKKISEADFDKQVLALGLAFKVGSKLIEKQLLNELINRELMLAEARAQNLYKPAYNDFLKIKESPRYKKMLELSERTPEEVKEDLINDRMLMILLEKIARENAPSDKELLSIYQKNQNSFKHGESIKLAHIVLAAPTIDMPPVESIKTQLRKQNPQMSEADLDKEVLVVKQQKLRLAEELLARANKGEDFKALADNFSEDTMARMAKSGGEIPEIDMSEVSADKGSSPIKTLVNAAKGVKPGKLVMSPVETTVGYHVVKVIDRKPAGTTSFDEAKEALKESAMAQNIEATKEKWLSAKRLKSKIVFSDEFTKASGLQAPKLGQSKGETQVK